MKSSFVRAAFAGALALVLAACGGKEQYTIQGGISGLTENGLVLSSGSQTVSPPAGATTFAFPNTIEYGETYKVEVKTQPRHQTCEVLREDGTAGQMASVQVFVRCFQNEYTLGGTVTGLTVDGLVLANGTSGGTVTINKNATGFVFPVTVKDGATYGVTVLTQPAGLVCTVANGVGTMGEAKVTNVVVTCAPPALGT